jgi:hypothetical protein
MHAWPSRLGLAAVALALVLALPTTAGASPAAGGSWSSPTLPGLNWLSHAWSRLQGLWPSIGCGSDPDGQKCGTSTIRPQEGCGSDPNGQHCGTSAIRPQIGCGSDPSGQHCPGNAPAPTTARSSRSRASGATGVGNRGGYR